VSQGREYIERAEGKGQRAEGEGRGQTERADGRGKERGQRDEKKARKA
jgi:hypothetical protein